MTDGARPRRSARRDQGRADGRLDLSTAPLTSLPAQQGVEHRVIPWKEVSTDGRHGHRSHRARMRQGRLRARQRVRPATIAPIDEMRSLHRWLRPVHGPVRSECRKADHSLAEGKGSSIAAEEYKHRLPDLLALQDELLFRLVDEWFINMDELRHQIMEVTRQTEWIPAVGPAARARLADEHARLDDLQETILGTGAADLSTARRAATFDVIGSRERVAASAPSRLGRVRRPHAAPAVDRRGQDRLLEMSGAPTSRITDVGNPWLDAGIVPYSTMRLQHRPRVLGEVVPGRLDLGELSGPVPQLVLRDTRDEHRDGESPAFQTAVRLSPDEGREGRGDAQEQGQRHRVQRGRRTRGRGRDAMALRFAQSRLRSQIRLA